MAPTDPRIQVPPNSELTLGAVCVDKAQAGRSVWHMAADERFANPAGTIQGGFLAALADSAMGAATITWAAGGLSPTCRRAGIGARLCTSPASR